MASNTTSQATFTWSCLQLKTETFVCRCTFCLHGNSKNEDAVESENIEKQHNRNDNLTSIMKTENLCLKGMAIERCGLSSGAQGAGGVIVTLKIFASSVADHQSCLYDRRWLLPS